VKGDIVEVRISFYVVRMFLKLCDGIRAAFANVSLDRELDCLKKSVKYVNQ